MEETKKNWNEENKKLRELIIKTATKSIFNLMSDLPFESFEWLIDEFISLWIWKITESSGKKRKTKYKGQRFWTLDALYHYIDKGLKGLRHEHVYKREKIIEKIKTPPKTMKNTENELREAVACIVTHEEHCNLRSGEKWERYIKAKFQVVDLLECRILKTEKDFEKLV